VQAVVSAHPPAPSSSRLPSCWPVARHVRLRNPIKSTLAHDAVAAVVLHEHHLIIRVGAGLIQFVYGSHSRMAVDLTLDKNLFPLPFSRAFSLDRGWDLFLVPSGWVRRIQFSVVERVGISSAFYFSFSPDQLMTIGCGVTFSSPQILSCPLPASLKKAGMVMAVSPWYLVAWKTLFNVINNQHENDLYF